LAPVALLLTAAGVDLWYRRRKSTRWKEYAFILADDPYEKRNLAKSELARVTDLLERLAQARKLDVAKRPFDP